MSRLLLWRASSFWIAFLILGFPVIFFIGAALQGNAASAPVLTRSIVELLPLIGFMLILGPMEEIGLAGLRSTIPATSASPVLGGTIARIYLGGLAYTGFPS